MRKALPISFNRPNICNLMAGLKTQTRRTMNPQPVLNGAFWEWAGAGWGASSSGPIPAVPGHSMAVRCPYGAHGDLLYVKEAAWMWCERIPDGTTRTGRTKYRYQPHPDAPIHYVSDHPDRPTTRVLGPETRNQWGWRYKAARFLPRWASRITLEIRELRVERLQNISAEDAIAEGIGTPRDLRYAVQDGFRPLWESINGPESWAANPWVWVIEFRVRQLNINLLMEEYAHG